MIIASCQLFNAVDRSPSHTDIIVRPGSELFNVFKDQIVELRKADRVCVKPKSLGD